VLSRDLGKLEEVGHATLIIDQGAPCVAGAKQSKADQAEKKRREGKVKVEVRPNSVRVVTVTCRFPGVTPKVMMTMGPSLSKSKGILAFLI
jgi:hypothetical protein